MRCLGQVSMPTSFHRRRRHPAGGADIEEEERRPNSNKATSGVPDRDFAQHSPERQARQLLQADSRVRGVQDQVALAKLFQVSEAAMAIRLRQVGLVGERSVSWTPLGIGNEQGGSVRRYFRRDPGLDLGAFGVTVEGSTLVGAV